MELVSLIIPVYNTDKYLEKCLDSIINQTYSNLEIIIVDDGSTDSCPQIIKRKEKADSRIVGYVQKNRGVSSARNKGISNASGSIIGFIDSDDWIEPCFIEMLVRDLDKHDIALCGMNTPGRVSHTYSMDQRDDSVDRIKYISDMLNIKNCTFTVTNKLFRRNIIGEIRFVDNAQYEDMMFSYQTGLVAEHIHYREDKLYNYFTRPDSYVNSASEKRAGEYVYAICHVYKLLEGQNLITELRQDIKVFLLKDLLFLTDIYLDSGLSENSYKEASSKIIDLFYEIE